jgi:hypothetical protein
MGRADSRQIAMPAEHQTEGSGMASCNRCRWMQEWVGVEESAAGSVSEVPNRDGYENEARW